MRVLMLSKALVVGTYQRKLERIAAHGVELLAVVPPVWADPSGVQPLERLHTEGYRLEISPIRLNGNFHLHYYPELPRLIRAFQPDVVHIDEEPYNAATWHALYFARQAGAKTLFFSWQNIYRQYPPPFAWGERYVLDHIDAGLMGTTDAETVWQAKGFRKLTRVIQQFGVDPHRFTFTTRDLRPDSPVVIAYMGRFVPEKGIDTLLQAVARLPIAANWRLRMVGSGSERETLTMLAEALGIPARVEWIGNVPSAAMPEQFQLADILVLPSHTWPNWKEQFGRVLIEAMASGTVVIGSDSGAIPTVIGDAGLIVPEGDAVALGIALERLITQPALRAEYAGRGRVRVEALYTTDQVALQTVAVYEVLMA